MCPYRSVVKNVFVVPKVRWAPFASSSSTSVFFPLVLFFLTPLSLCVALYHGAGLGPCSLDPFCLLASWLTPPIPPPRSDAASRGTAQRQGLQKALKPGEPELLLPQFRTGRVGGRGWHVFSQQCASKWMRIGVYVWSSEVSLCPLPPLSTGLTVRLSARDPASYLRLRQCRGKSSAKRSPAGEGDDANLPSPLTWSRGSSLKDSVSRIHGSGAGNTSRDGGRAKERGVDGEV